jgi:hypothetical protein
LNHVKRRSLGCVLGGGSGDWEWRTALFGFVLILPPERTPSGMTLGTKYSEKISVLGVKFSNYITFGTSYIQPCSARNRLLCICSAGAKSWLPIVTVWFFPIDWVSGDF